MKIKHIKKLAKEFCKRDDISPEDIDLIYLFLNFLKQENRTRKCGTQDGSPQMPILPNLD